MQVTLSDDALAYLRHDKRTVDQGAGPVELHFANEHSRRFVDELRALPAWVDEQGNSLCDAIHVERDPAFPIGGTPYDVLLFTLTRAGYDPKTIIIRASDVQDRHPDPRMGGEVLFRGHRFIAEVLTPAVCDQPWRKSDGA